MKNYVLGDLVGRGGMGQVHSARDPSGRAVVVKRLRNTLAGNPSLADRLADEARLLGQVVHHNVARAVDRGKDTKGAPFLVMDHAAGISLAKLIDRDGPLPLHRTFAIASQLIAGVVAIHEAGIVHADLKSSNVLIDDNDRVTIIDFGLARPVDGDVERNGTVAGTPAYMAPEVIGGGVPTVAADVYGLGVILYEMLAGATPFALAQDVFAAHLYEPVIPPSMRAPNRTISVALDRLALRALAKQPAQRFATVRDLGVALDEVVAADWMMTTIQACSFEEAQTIQVRKSAPAAARVATEPCDVQAIHTQDMIASSLQRARELIAAQEPSAAVIVLELAMGELGPGIATDLPICAEAWRIETVLAALYHTLGRKERARRIAMAAYKHAMRTGCKVAVARAEALIDRLSNRPERKPAAARIAKGSAEFRRLKR